MSDDRLKIGSQFFSPLHYRLNFNWMSLGTWIVGFAALIMLVALVSGFVLHRKIFREFFTFRPKKHTQRSALDLHNLTGVVALPFHFIFAFSGLVGRQGHGRRGRLPERAAGGARQRLCQRLLRRHRPRDADGRGIHYKASTGAILNEDPPFTAVASINNFLTSLHLQHFRHRTLRWLYFICGLSGCVCIATGFIFFVEKRKRQHAKQGVSGSRWVDAFAISTETGMLCAALVMLIANRLLPDTLPARGDWEQTTFWSAWVLAFAHGIWRTAPVAEGRMAPAWVEQCWAVAALAVVAVLLNSATTGDHLLRTVAEGYWPVAGADLVMLAGAALAVVAARRLRRRAQGPLLRSVSTGTAGAARA